MNTPYLRETNEGVLIRIHAQPNAKQSQIAGLHGDELKIRLRAPPVNGKANEALVEFLSELLGVARSGIEIVRGDTSRSKQVLIRGTTIAQIDALNLHAPR